MGCQDLLEEVPGRSRKEKEILSTPNDLKSFVKGVTGRSSCKSYSVKDEISSKKLHTYLMAMGESGIGNCWLVEKFQRVILIAEINLYNINFFL